MVRETFLPLDHQPGQRAECDFGQLYVGPRDCDDSGAGISQRLRTASADSAPRACYNRNLSIKLHTHSVLHIACECIIA